MEFLEAEHVVGSQSFSKLSTLSASIVSRSYRLALLPLLCLRSARHVRASKPSCPAVAMTAVLRLDSTRVASSHVLQPSSADGMVDGCHAPPAQQELQFISTLRREDR